MIRHPRPATAVPLVASLALLLAACGSNSAGAPPVAQGPASTVVQSPETPGSSDSTAALVGAVADFLDAQAKRKAASGKSSELAGLEKAVRDAELALAAKDAEAADSPGSGATTDQPSSRGPARVKVSAPNLSPANVRSIDAATAKATNESVYQAKDGATDVGITKEAIRLGSVSMHGMALGNVLIRPIADGIRATMTSINDRGGIAGRRMSLVDCDDGPGDTARSKACLKKLVGQDKIFGLLSYTSWASASVHEDLRNYKLPAVGTWAYSQTEWQDPYMFPTHMSMIHEAMAGANWVKNVVKPKTYGMFCLTSPEMQLACDTVQKIMDASGAKLVQKIDVGITETSMSPYVLAMRAANPDHIIHYVINATSIGKFMIETELQGYYPPKGISGNHLAAEVLGGLFGQWPANRYWTNTTYKLWGPEFMATMSKYATSNKGANHHIVQSSYTGVQVFAQAAKAVGPNLTRERLMAQLANGDVYYSDASLGQKFSWTNSERYGDNWDHEMGQGREFMYKYTSSDTVGNPDGSPSGFAPDPDQFVIKTHD